KKKKYVTIRNASEQIINFQGKLSEALSSEPLDSESEPEKEVPSTKKQKMDDNELPFSKDDVDKEIQESLGVESVGVGGVTRGLDEELDDELDDEEGLLHWNRISYQKKKTQKTLHPRNRNTLFIRLKKVQVTSGSCLQDGSAKMSYGLCQKMPTVISDPSRFSVIRLGEGVRRPESIEREDWSYFQRSLPLLRDIMTDECEKILFLLVQAESPSDLEKVSVRGTKAKRAGFSIQVLSRYIGFLDNLHVRDSPPEPACPRINTWDSASSSDTESSNDWDWQQAGIPSVKAKSSLNRARASEYYGAARMKTKTDLLARKWTSGGTEVGIVELSGGPQTADLPRYIKDHVRGLWSMRDLLNDIIVGPDFSSGNFAEMRYVQA
ncbi:hypothetical protein BC936DRAFT_150074, partial [Jimgerdemannia flammicorona]